VWCCALTHSTTRVTTYTCYTFRCHNTGNDLQDFKFSVFLYRHTPWWWSVEIENCRSVFMYFYVFWHWNRHSRLIYCWMWSALVGVYRSVKTEKMHGETLKLLFTFSQLKKPCKIMQEVLQKRRCISHRLHVVISHKTLNFNLYLNFHFNPFDMNWFVCMSDGMISVAHFERYFDKLCHSA